MFEWILFGLIAAVTVAACITIDTLREAMDKAKIDNGEIIATFIKGAKKVVKLQDLESRLQIEVTGDDISDDLYVGQKIRRKPVATAPKNEERILTQAAKAVVRRIDPNPVIILEAEDGPWILGR